MSQAAQDAEVVDEYLVILLGNAEVRATADGQQWTAIVDSSGRLLGSSWPAIAAATEGQGQLVLALGQGQQTAVVTFDPGRLAWGFLGTVKGQAERFAWPGSQLFLITQDGSRGRQVFQIGPEHAPFTAFGGPLWNVNFFGEEIWALDQAGVLISTRAEGANCQRAVQGFEVALPASGPGSLMAAAAVGKQLIVSLADGSIWHRAEGTVGWRQVRQFAGAANFRRQLVMIGGVLLTSEPDGSLLVYDTNRGEYRPLRPGEQLTPTQQAESAREVDHGALSRVRASSIDRFDRLDGFVGRKITGR